MQFHLRNHKNPKVFECDFMDLWVVAAAAGAGYIAKNIQNSSLDKKENPIEQSHKYSITVQSESRNFLQQLRDKTCPLRKLGQKTGQNYAFPEVEIDSDVNFSEINRLNNTDFESGLASISGDGLGKDGLDEDHNMRFEDAGIGNFGRVRKGKSIRTRKPRLNSIRPLHYIGSCLESMEDGTCLYPTISAVRPVLVTDGSRIISKSSSCSTLSQLEGCKEDAILLHSRERDTSTMLLFITGMTIGIMSASLAWKREVDKLNKQLKQQQNLVQDLQEELDMKEMLTVKQLIEPISSLEANDKNTENNELMNKIEAELQAELEMLENNMKGSEMERISEVVELDSDFEPEIIKGDLKPTIATGLHGDSSGSGPTNCPPPSNYPICPWELSLRLHELIESRLEKRIKDLEIALSNSQSQTVVSKSRLSYSETESSSHQSPICTYDEQEMEYELSDSFQDFPESRDKKMSMNFMLNDDFESEDEGSGDESEMLLIKQILERRKSGSSFNLKF